jgi:membrane protease YdiL (CAAX protease family)
MTDFQISNEVIRAILTLTITVTGFYTYHFSAGSRNLSKWIKLIAYPENEMVYLFIKNKLLGFAFLGIIPYLASRVFEDQEKYTYSTDILHGLNIRVLIPSAFLIIFFTALFTARKKNVYDRFPQLRLKNWTLPKILINAGGWALYLLAYEYLFRDFLLFSWAEAFGIIPAIAVNLALYSAFHLPAGLAETIGSLVFGFALCITSLLTGSFVMAFILHLTLSLSYEMFAICYNPDMRFTTGKKTP